MSLTTARQRAESILRFLPQRVSGMETFHIANYRLALAGFCDELERDDVLEHLWRVFQERQPGPVRAWYRDAQASGELPPFPADPAACFALRYMLMKHVRMDKVDLRFFVTHLFPGSHLNERLMHWKRLVVHPFAADCRTLSRGVIARLGDAEWVDMKAELDAYLDGPFQEEGWGPRTWTDADDEAAEAAEAAPETDAAATAPAPTPAAAATAAPSPAAGAPLPQAAGAAADPLEAALGDLDAAAAALGDAGRDLRRDVAALRLEGRRRTRRPDRIRARLATLAAAGLDTDRVAALLEA